MTRLALLIALLAGVQATVLHYTYKSNMNMWGTTNQRFEVTASIKLQNLGSAGGTYSGTGAVLYLVQVYDITVHTVKDGEVLKSGVMTNENRTKVKHHHIDKDFKLPFRFVQNEDGSIAEAQFDIKDIKDKDVINFKKTIISAFQTWSLKDKEGSERISEMDTVGQHFTTYKVTTVNGIKRIKKTYKTNDVQSFGANNINADGLDVESKEDQEFTNGTLTKAKGNVTMKVNDHRKARLSTLPEGKDIADNFASRGDYEMDLKETSKRGLEREARAFTESTFVSQSLVADIDKDSGRRDRLERLLDLINEAGLKATLNQFFQDPNKLELLSHIKEAVYLENMLRNADSTGDIASKQLIDALVALTKQKLLICESTWATCKELINIYSAGGNPRAEKELITLLKGSSLSKDHMMELLNEITLMRYPSDAVAHAVKLSFTLESDNQLHSALLLAMGAIAGEPTISPSLKTIIANILLEKIQGVKDSCDSSDDVTDALEAIGNAGDNRFISHVTDIVHSCAGKHALLIASIHAVRELVTSGDVQELLEHLVWTGNCDVKVSVISILRDRISEDVLNGIYGWPRVGVEDLDTFIVDFYNNQTHGSSCGQFYQQVHLYLEDKLGEDAETLLNDVRKSKRGLLKHSSCNVWSTHSYKYDDLQSRSTFISDNSKYPTNKHCLAHMQMGITNAQANLYAGAFAGFNTKGTGECSFDGKLFAKIYADGKVLGKSFYIATAEFYAIKYSNTITLKAYIKIGGKTLLNYNPTVPAKFTKTWKWTYGTNWNIPISSFNIKGVKITLGVTISPSVEFSITVRSCLGCGICVSVKPKVMLKVAGSATAEVAKVARAGISVDVSLNYNLRATGNVGIYRDTCVGLYHGHDPMTVSFKAWYQLASKVSIKVKLWPPKFSLKWEWGSKKTYSLNTEGWSIAESSETKIFWGCMKGKIYIKPPIFELSNQNVFQLPP